MNTKLALSAVGLKVKLGKTQVLHDVNLAVKTGQVYGLLGRNGAGKTTSLRCALGFLPFEGGKVEVFGTPAYQLHRVPEQLGVALDPPGMDDTLTVRQNLELARIRGGLESGRGVDEALELVGLTHRSDNAGDRLSHGQSRRAAVARALLGSPALLLLDEPLSGLDPEGVEVLLGLFRHLADEEGVTVVLSSHHLREVQHICDQVGLIEQGKTILEGEVDSLLKEAGDGLRLACGKPEIAQNILQETSGIRECTPQAEGQFLARLDADVDIPTLLEKLVKGGAEVSEFSRDRATLVDVFHQAIQRQSA